MRQVTQALGGRFAFGGDYNPEQWPESVWAEDVALMRQAGVNLVTVGVFSWALLETAEGTYDFGWLDRVLDGLNDDGIRVDLATATASPPPWFSHTYPHTRLVDATGARRQFGARQGYCPSAPEYRRAAAALASQLAARYAAHPAVVMWHVNNEYGNHNWHCYCDVSAAAFREWLRDRYRSLDALNTAWGTAFWSQHYTAWEQIGSPGAVSYGSFASPGQQLDWWRFGSDELLACYRAEFDAIRAVAAQPITTNFMSFWKPVDYRRWAGEVDIVSNDHYLQAEDPDNAAQLAMCADLLRSLAHDEPWLVMEHSTSAVNWQRRNLAKQPGQMLRNSLQHVARGADGALFFQWRASRAGAEKFHSALVPHAGTDSRVWREVVELGAALQAIGEVTGTRPEPAPAALLFDWASWWAAELDSHPSTDVDVRAELRRWHDALWARNVAVDIVGPLDDLGRYRLIVAPVQYLLDDAAIAALAGAAAAGATVVVTYFSGIVDEHDHIRLGGYPGALRELLGVRVEEFYPLAADGRVELTEFGPGRVWSELARADTAEVISSYRSDGAVDGSPAVTRRRVGAGASATADHDAAGGMAWYVGCVLEGAGLDALVGRLLAEADVAPVLAGLPRGVEVLRRTGEHCYLFAINHTAEPVSMPVTGTELVTGAAVAGALTVAGGGVAVVRESTDTRPT